MKKCFLLLTMFFLIIVAPNCTTDDTTSTQSEEWKCGVYNGHQLYTGPKGGCFYYNSNGNKTYVDRSNCKC
jgi:hypothetical protein